MTTDFEGEIAVVLDGGPCRVGVESTIVDASTSTPRLLRVGAISMQEIEEVIGQPLHVLNQGEVAAPGTHSSHYAPRCRVEVLGADAVNARAQDLLRDGKHVAVLAMIATSFEIPAGAVRLPSPETVDDYARTLYARMREADTLGVDTLLAVPPAPGGVGAAVVDRLQRAATVLL